MVEASGAIAIAPLLNGSLDVAGRTVICVLSGGNIETALLRDVLIEFTRELPGRERDRNGGVE